MANSYSPSVSAVQVGSYFVQQYYQILQEQPEFAHRFYNDASTMVRIDGDLEETATGTFQIHTLIQSFGFSGVEIKTINSLDSLAGGVFVAVSGSVRSKYFSWRKFVQNFLLAPQEKGYFVMNDVFHFVSDEVVQHQPPVVVENKVDSQQIIYDTQLITSEPAASQPISSPPPELAEDALEVEAREDLNSFHIEGDDQGDYYSSQELQQQQDYVQEPIMETFEEETAVEEPPSLLQNVVEYVKEPMPVAHESVVEPVKLTYASILRAPKSNSAPSVPVQKTYTNSVAPTTEWHQMPEPIVQQAVAPFPLVPEATPEVAEEVSPHDDEGQSKSVYVRNLPTTVSVLDIHQEFKNFGRIKHDGVFLKNRQDVGICFAFVEFEDMDSVQKAIEASPIHFAGRQIYVEERRANSNSTSRGGRRGGRGRGSYQYDSTRGRYGGGSYSRGGYQDGRGNGFRN